MCRTVGWPLSSVPSTLSHPRHAGLWLLRPHLDSILASWGSLCSGCSVAICLESLLFYNTWLLLLLILDAFEIFKKICWVPVNLKPLLWSFAFQVPCPPCGRHKQRPQGPHKLPVTDVRETWCQPMLTQQMQDKGNELLNKKAVTPPRSRVCSFSSCKLTNVHPSALRQGLR